MSTTIDQRVVEMRFDNKHFEQNVSTTMSTLDKLKQKLHLDGATKGLEGVNNAAKKVDMAGIGTAVDTVQAKFSAMQVVGITALTNITNSAIETGKRMLSALTVDPIKTGFSEYELKMDSIKTIMASTGKDVDTVNGLLNELNEYSDQTIYSFADMTQNIGKFTNAGVKLEDAVLAIKGISNEAAVSGANANEASRAMYNFAQALSAGYVKLIDWKSIENANMATVEFKQQLIDTAVELGTVKEAADGMYKTLDGNDFNATRNFNDVLQDQWMTTEVLVQTLGRYADATTDIGKKAFAAAQDVTKFTQVWDILKETAQSGWARTWELLVGNIDQAKALLTPLTNTLSGIIDTFSDARNNLLEELLGSKWDKLSEKILNAGLTTEVFEGRLRKLLEMGGYNVDKLLEKYGSFEKILKNIPNGIGIVQQALNGLVGNTTEVIDKLFDVSGITRFLGWGSIGDDVKKVQDALVKLGYSLDMFGVDGIIGPETTAAIKAFQKFAEIQVDGIVGPETLAALERFNVANKQIVDSNGELIISYEELQAALQKKTGRELLVETVQNAGNGLLGVFQALKEAWQEIFPPKSVEEKAAGLYKILEAVNKFSEKLRLTYSETNEETGEVTKKLNDNGLKLKRTFEGIFAVVGIVADVIGGAFRIAFKVVSEVLKYFNLNILDVTAAIGDALVWVKEMYDSLFDISWILDKVAPLVDKAAVALSNWFEAFKASEGMQKTIDYINELGTSIRDWWANLLDAEDLPKTIAEGFVNFFSNIPTIIKTVFSHIKDALSESFRGFNESPLGGFLSNVRYWLGIAGQTIIEIGKLLLEKVNGFLSARGFEEISEDSIAGLVNGLKDGASKVWESAIAMAKELVQKVKDYLGIHSPSTVFMAIGGFIIAGLVAGLKNGIPDSLGAVKDVLQPILDWLQGIDFGAILAAIVGIGTVSATNKIGDALGAFAAPIAGLGDVFEGVGKVLVKSARPIALVIKNSAKVVKSFSKVLNSIAFETSTKGIKNLTECLLMLVGAVIVLTFFDPIELLKAVGIVFALSAILVGLAFATSAISKSSMAIGKDGINVQGLSTGLIGIGVAILLIAASVKMMDSLENAGPAFLRLGGLILAIVAIVAAFGLLVKGKSAQNIDKFGIMMTKMGVALLLMVAVVKLAGHLKPEEMTRAAGFLAEFLVFFALVNVIALMPSKNIGKLGGMMVSMALSLLLMVAVVKLAAGLSPEELKAGKKFLSMFAEFVLALNLIALIPGKGLKGLSGMLLSMSVSMLLMIGIMKLIGMLSPGEIIKGGAAIIAFSVIIALMVKSIMANGPQAPKVAGTILAFSIAIGILAAVAIVCSLISLEGLVKGIAAVSTLSVMMAIMIAATRGANNVVGSIVAISIAIGLLVAAVALLTLVDPTKLAITTTAVSVLMGILAIVIQSSKNVTSAWGTLLAIAGIITLIGGVLYLLAMLPVESVMGSAIGLSSVLLSITGVLVVLTILGPMSTAAYPAMLALAALIGGIGVVLAALGGLMKAIPELGSILDTGIQVLEKIGYAIGSFVGNIIAGIAGAVISVLPAFGTALSSFMTELSGFIEGIRSIDSAVLTGAGILVATIVAFAAAGMVSGIAALSGLGLLALALEMSAFMIALKPFIAGASTITPESMAGIKALAEAILILTAANVLDGLSSLLGGGNSLENFANQLPVLGQGLASFSSSLGTFTEDQVNTVKCAAEAVKTLASAASEIPNTGGLLASLVGENDLGTFAAQFPVLATGLATFLANIGTFTDEQVATVDCAANAIKSLASAASEIPNTGGLLGQLVGDNDLGTFAEQFPKLGTGLAAFLTNVGTFTDEQVATVDCAANAIKSLASASSEIPNSGGWIGAIVGDNDLGTFAEQFPKLGTGLRGLVDNLGSFTADQVTTVSSAVTAINSLTGLANADLKGASKHLGDVSAKLPSVGTAIGSFCSNMPAVDSVISAVDGLNRILDAIKSVADANSGALATFANNLKKVGTDAVKKFVDAFTGGSAKSDLKKAAKDLGDQVVDGVKAKESAIKTAGKKAAKKAVDGAETQKDSMKSAGKDLGSGLVSGIKAKWTAAYNAGYTLGQMAVQGEKDGQQSNSPSKLTIQAGQWIGEGLIIGIGKMGNQVYSAGHTLGDTATKSISSSISRISDMVSMDIDSQPTIRPVLDLSDVKAGMGALNGMLDMQSAVGVTANVGAISTMMNARGQNGANDDVISAIDKLRRDLGNVGGTTYQINGITYDDGSNVSNAIKEIARYATIERRI